MSTDYGICSMLHSSCNEFTPRGQWTLTLGYIFGLLDMHNDAFVELTGYPEKNGNIVVENLEFV